MHFVNDVRVAAGLCGGPLNHIVQLPHVAGPGLLGEAVDPLKNAVADPTLRPSQDSCFVSA